METNCEQGALVKGIRSPGMEEYVHFFQFVLLFFKLCSDLNSRFRFQLPKDVIPDGNHELIQDPSEAYFGIRMQKKADFVRRAMVTSARSKEKQQQDEAEAKAKAKLANQFLDDEAAYAYCQKFMAEMAEKNKARTGVSEKQDEVVDSMEVADQ